MLHRWLLRLVGEFLAGLREQTRSGWLLRYGLAGVAIAAAMAVALLAGFGPGLLATALAGLTAACWILPPVGQFAISSPADRVALLLFTGMGLFMSVVAEFYRRNRRKAAAYDREAALRDSRARLATFAEVTFEGIVESEAGRIVDCNEQLARLLGYSVAELRGMEIANLIAPEDRDRAMANIRKGRESAIEHAMHHKDGTRIVVETRGRPLSPGGTTRHTTIRDITERKRAEEQLREREQQLRLFVEHAPAPIAMLDTQMRYLAVSKRWMTTFGLTGRQILGRSHYEVFPEIPDRWKEVHRRCLAGAVERAEEDPFQRADGSMQWIRWEIRPWQAAGGAIGGIIIFSEDITGRKQSDQQLKELNTTLEQRVAERTAETQQRAEQLRALAAQLTQAEQKERQRLATILHDHLQQLLVGTKFHLGIVRGRRKDPDLQESLEQIDSLLDQSLDASRNLTVDLSPPILKHGNMTQVLYWLADWMRNKHGLEVRLQADEQANPHSHEVRVLLFQAVRELLFNTAKHARVNEATVELCRLGHQHVRVIVRDSGIGFDASKGKTGSGLGLFAIRERLHWLGGTFQIDSRPGEGTCATLSVPVGLSKAVDTDQIQAAVHAVEGAPATNGSRRAEAGRAIRVLLADDHAVMRDGLSSLLQGQLDIDVVGKATDGQEAVDLALQLQPDVIIMDISMPRLDGVEATRRIKARHPQVQVIGLSMFNDEGAAKSMEAAGAAQYLAKTSEPEALIAAIRGCAREPAIEPGV